MVFDEKGMTGRGRPASPTSVLILDENGKIVTNLVLSCHSGPAMLDVFVCILAYV